MTKNNQAEKFISELTTGSLTTIDFWHSELIKLNIWLEFPDFYHYVHEALNVLNSHESLANFSPTYLFRLWLISFDREPFLKRVEQEKLSLEKCSEIARDRLAVGVEKTIKDLDTILKDLDLVINIADKNVKKQLSILALFALYYQYDPFYLSSPLWKMADEEETLKVPMEQQEFRSSLLFRLIEVGFTNEGKVNIDSCMSISPMNPCFMGSLWRSGTQLNINLPPTDLQRTEIKKFSFIHECVNMYARLITDVFLRWFHSSYSREMQNPPGQMDRSYYISLLQEIPDADYLVNLFSYSNIRADLLRVLGLGNNIQKILLLYGNAYDTPEAKLSLIDSYSRILVDFFDTRMKLIKNPITSTRTNIKSYNYNKLLHLFLCLYAHAGETNRNKQNKANSVTEAIQHIDLILPGFKKKQNVPALCRGRTAMRHSVMKKQLQSQGKKLSRLNWAEMNMTSQQLVEQLPKLTQDIPPDILKYLQMDE